MNLREAEAKSIYAFVEQAGVDGYLKGRVLDYGCGKQPYRGIVEAAGGEYVGYDSTAHPANVSGTDVGIVEFMSGLFDTALCTQVLQYAAEPRDVLIMLAAKCDCLVLTYPTNWPEVEKEDLHRFTKAGMERLLTEAGFTIVRHDFRHGIQYEGVSFAMGYGVVARA